jgi:SurA N-terminal domain.
MNSLKHVSKLLASSVVWLACTTASAQASVLDRIVAVVDSGVVLESDVERRLNDLKAQADARGNSIEISEALKEQVLER